MEPQGFEQLEMKEEGINQHFLNQPPGCAFFKGQGSGLDQPCALLTDQDLLTVGLQQVYVKWNEVGGVDKGMDSSQYQPYKSFNF